MRDKYTSILKNNVEIFKSYKCEFDIYKFSCSYNKKSNNNKKTVCKCHGLRILHQLEQ